jgi:hypothetical protein
LGFWRWRQGGKHIGSSSSHAPSSRSRARWPGRRS